MGKGKRKKLNKAANDQIARQDCSDRKNTPENIGVCCNWGGKLRKNNRYHLIALLTICVLCAIIYSNTLHSPFVFDESPNIVKNPHIRLISLDLQKLYDAGFKSPTLRPVANISFALNYYFGRYDVLGYHLANIIIHIINGILVYFIALTIFSQIRPSHTQTLNHSTSEPTFLMALFSALFFVVHPVQTQAVTYIVQRMTSMSVMFFLLSLFFYTRGRLSQIGWRRWSLFFGCFASWILALGCKQIAVTLPFIVLLFEWYFFQDLSTAWLKKNVKYFLIPIAALCLLAFIYLGSNPFDKILAAYEIRDFTMLERVLTQPRVVIYYISLLFYPHPSRLNLEHHFTTSHSLVNPTTTLLSLLTILGLVGLALYFGRRNRLISFGILWFFINLALESSVIGLEMIFEHRLYLPILGPVLIVSYLLFHFSLKRRSWAVIVSAFIILSLGIATYSRNNVWRSKISLWQDCVEKSPNKPRPWHNLGDAFADLGLINEAIDHYSAALRIKPDYVAVHNNLGAALEKLGRSDEAIDYFTRALRMDPDDHRPHHNLGLALAKKGDYDEAIKHYLKALQIKPEYEDAHYNLGVALEKKGDYDEAIKNYLKVLQINPDNDGAYYNVGLALADQGKFDEAVKYFSMAVRIKPNNANTYNSLGNCFLMKGKINEAIIHYRKALLLQPDHDFAQKNLMNALEKQQ